MRAVDHFAPPTFAATDTQSWLAELEANGCVVLREFLPQEGRAELLEQLSS